MTFGIHQTNFFLNLDFNPIINYFNLEGNYILQHWQAKPFGYRHFGYFVCYNNESRYITIPSGFCKIQVTPQTLQINEIQNKGKVPTAVLYYPNSLLLKSQKPEENNIWHLLPESEVPF